jgi:hypothetical protein
MLHRDLYCYCYCIYVFVLKYGHFHVIYIILPLQNIIVLVCTMFCSRQLFFLFSILEYPILKSFDVGHTRGVHSYYRGIYTMFSW